MFHSKIRVTRVNYSFTARCSAVKYCLGAGALGEEKAAASLADSTCAHAREEVGEERAVAADNTCAGEEAGDGRGGGRSKKELKRLRKKEQRAEQKKLQPMSKKEAKRLRQKERRAEQKKLQPGVGGFGHTHILPLQTHKSV